MCTIISVYIYQYFIDLVNNKDVVIYTYLLVIPVLDLCKYQCLQSVVAMRVRYRVSVVDYVRSVQGTVINSGDQLLITSGVTNKV